MTKECEVTMSSNGKRVYIETYGCQMNVYDSQIVASIVSDAGYTVVTDPNSADIYLINTCSIRGSAENKVFSLLRNLRVRKADRTLQQVGVLGCMGVHQRSELQNEEWGVDFVLGPDAYRSLPTVLRNAADYSCDEGVESKELYDGLYPYVPSVDGVTSFVSIMRGCNNFCSYCVVPFTRGRERSRSSKSILLEIERLAQRGVKEVTLLGQNVNSYRGVSECSHEEVTFPKLLELIALQEPDMRIRFSTSHPKDLSEDLLDVMAQYDTICHHIHLPVQSGSNAVLKRMNRGYTVESYLSKVEAIRTKLPDCALTTDLIVGFSDETEEDFQATLSLLERVRFDSAFMFMFSEREGTFAANRLQDNVSSAVKSRRLSQLIEVQREHSLWANQQEIGRVVEVLVERESTKSELDLCGRASNFKMVVFPKEDVAVGTFQRVKIVHCTSSTLLGEVAK